MRGVVFELDDLLSIVELAKAVEKMPDKPLDREGKPMPIRVSVGDAVREGWVAHVVVDTVGDTYVDFTPEERKP